VPFTVAGFNGRLNVAVMAVLTFAPVPFDSGERAVTDGARVLLKTTSTQ
jgi:hypothetical protein